jgi:fibronectin type 3 domain-containing protein
MAFGRPRALPTDDYRGDGDLLAMWLAPNATSFADTNVTAGNSYTYEVGTLNQAGVSLCLRRRRYFF